MRSDNYLPYFTLIPMRKLVSDSAWFELRDVITTGMHAKLTYFIRRGEKTHKWQGIQKISQNFVFFPKQAIASRLKNSSLNTAMIKHSKTSIRTLAAEPSRGSPLRSQNK